MSDAPAEPPYDQLPELSSDVRNWAMLCHLSALAGIVVPGVGMVVGPLVVWLLKGKEHPFIDAQGKEAVNFQISMLIYGVLAGLSLCIVIGVVLLPLVAVMDVVFVVLAAVKASAGIAYRYPLTIRLVN